MFKLSISNCLANKTSLDLYSKCIFKGIKPISTEKLNDFLPTGCSILFHKPRAAKAS